MATSDQNGFIKQKLQNSRKLPTKGDIDQFSSKKLFLTQKCWVEMRTNKKPTTQLGTQKTGVK